MGTRTLRQVTKSSSIFFSCSVWGQMEIYCIHLTGFFTTITTFVNLIKGYRTQKQHALIFQQTRVCTVKGVELLVDAVVFQTTYVIIIRDLIFFQLHLFFSITFFQLYPFFFFSNFSNSMTTLFLFLSLNKQLASKNVICTKINLQSVL